MDDTQQEYPDQTQQEQMRDALEHQEIETLRARSSALMAWSVVCLIFVVLAAGLITDRFIELRDGADFDDQTMYQIGGGIGAILVFSLCIGVLLTRQRLAERKLRQCADSA